MGLGAEYSLADIAAATGGGNRNNGGGFGMDGQSGWWIILLFLVLGGRNWNGGGGTTFVTSGFGGLGCGGGCATQADVRAAVDQQTLISKLDNQTYGLADSTYALNNTINQNFRGVDNAICNLGFNIQQGFNGLGMQFADCCCKTQGAIAELGYQGAMNTNAITKQIADCCCDMEKMSMQNRFDAAMANNGTLQAIDRLGDRIIDYMCQNEKQNLRDENTALRLAASQAKQNQYLIDQLRPAPVPAFAVSAPYNFGGCAPISYGCGCGC